MKLCRNEAGLLLHKRRIVLPDLEKDLLIGLIQCEDVDQYNGGGVRGELTFDRERRVKWAQLRHSDSVKLAAQCQFDMTDV